MKKGQAAMEFLMTYGWAILVVIIAISTLIYFGILDFSSLLPDRCDLQPEIGCVQFRVSTNSVQLVLRNDQGMEMTNVRVKVENCGTNNSVGTIAPNEEKLVVVNCATPLTAGTRFKANFYVVYDMGKITNYNKTGRIIARVS